MSKEVIAVIVNYKTPGLVMNCLETVAAERERISSPLSVIVVDNNSPDDSCSLIPQGIEKEGWTEWVTFIPHDKNGGFSAGNNVGFRQILKDKTDSYIWLLNSDTLVHEGGCEELIRFLDENPNVGIVGSRLEDPDGTAQVSEFRDFSVGSEFLSGFRFSLFSKIFSQWDIIPDDIPLEPRKTCWVAGASMMVRHEVLRGVGLFDETFFLYFEEVDFCLNVRRSGWECWYVPSSRVIHLVGASTGISELRKQAPRRPAYWFESRRLFFLKNYGAVTLFWADFWFILGYFSFRTRKAFSQDVKLEPPRFLGDFISHSVFRKGFRQ
jgi:N-acetylglucosaminyl-diphospho-decaprenol L-rhamnosyltransferase